MTNTDSSTSVNNKSALSKWLYPAILLAALILGTGLVIAFADDIYEGSRYRADWIPTILLDDDNAMQALSRSGQIISPENIAHTLERKYGGRVTDLDFERGLLRYYYEIEMRDPDGTEWDIEVDARSGELLYKQRDWD